MATLHHLVNAVYSYRSAILKSYNRCLRCYLVDGDYGKPAPAADRIDDISKTAFDLRRRVISMVLYGSDARYTMGAIRNAQLLPVVFPGWKLRFYVKQTVQPTISGDLGTNDLLVTSAEIIYQVLL